MAKSREVKPKPEPLWTADQVAEYLNASRAWVYREANAGNLPSVRVLGLLRFDPAVITHLNEKS